MASPTGSRGSSDTERVLEDDLDLSAHTPACPPNGASVNCVPSKLTEPDVGAISWSIDRPVVDLPQPDSPTRPSVSPGEMVNETPLTTCTTPTRCRTEGAAPEGELLDKVGDFEQRRLR